jgi:putative membrane protein
MWSISRIRFRTTVCPFLSSTKDSGLTERHHLHGTRPLPQPPLSYLLPSAYLSSLRRTEARVRFAETHAPPASPGNVITEEEIRPGLRRRSTGPKPDGDKDGNEEEWELSDLRLKAEEAVEKLSKAVANAGEDLEFRQQLNQLNLPISESSPPRPSTSKSKNGERRRKSNLCAPYPPNMPLALLKLMESYVIGLAEVPKEKGGWAEAKRERGLTLVKSLSSHLGDAERLSSSTSFLIQSAKMGKC